MSEQYTISPLGNDALLLDFGNKIDDGINKKVLRFFYKLQQLSLPVITDLVPAYSSLAVYYDVMALHQKDSTAFEKMKGMLIPLLVDTDQHPETGNRTLKIPVCYAQPFAPDIITLAKEKNFTVEEVIALHYQKLYRVYMIGFLPGFAYMGKVDERLAAPRKATPVNVAPGSVGIAGEQTGIYPLASPGGWNIIGRTPIKLFDKKNKKPVLMQPGDEIQFYPITEHEFENHQGRNS